MNGRRPEERQLGGREIAAKREDRDQGGRAVRACLALVELKRRFLGNGR